MFITCENIALNSRQNCGILGILETIFMPCNKVRNSDFTRYFMSNTNRENIKYNHCVCLQQRRNILIYFILFIHHYWKLVKKYFTFFLSYIIHNVSSLPIYIITVIIRFRRGELSQLSKLKNVKIFVYW